MTVRLSDTLKESLEQLAEVTARSKSFLAAEAIKQYIDINEWQINEIKKALVEADAGKFIAHADIVRHWENKLEHCMDTDR
jgi:predicted transcriptional regulator